MSATATFDSDTEARFPLLLARDSVEIVEKTTALSCAQRLGSPDVQLLWQESSMPTTDDELARLPKAYDFITNKPELAAYEGWLISGTFPAATSFAAVAKGAWSDGEEPDGDQSVEEDLIDWEIRITSPPPRVVKTVVMNFIPAGKRQPRISVDSLE